MKNKIKKITMWTLTLVASYFIIGLVIHHWILPTKTPDLKDYFKIGQTFQSKLEGLTQTIVKVDSDKITTDIEIQPKSNGPVTHLHENFEEIFIVKSGTLSLQLGSEVKKLVAGQKMIVPKNTAHNPFNETDSSVFLTCEMPIEFAYCLSQIYPFWDENEANTKPPNVILQIAVFGDKFDSYPTKDAPPKPVLKALKFLLAPTARLLGYKIYNEKYKPK